METTAMLVLLPGVIPVLTDLVVLMLTVMVLAI